MDQTFSIGGGSGSGTINLSFTASASTYALHYVDTLVGAVQDILNNGGNTDPLAPLGGQVNNPDQGTPDGTPIYQLVPTTVQAGPQTFDIVTMGYAIDSVPGAVVIDGDSAGGDSILVAGGGTAAATVNTYGSDNLVVFVDGNNQFDGSLSGGGETVVGGTGEDTIDTGTGNTTVNAGTGTDIIYLNDTGTGGLGDDAYLDSGNDLVLSNGVDDFVVSTSEGETMVGGATENAADSLTVALLANNDGTPDGNDVVNGGSGALTVFDESSANSINGGSGSLVFVGGIDITATIDAGSGTAALFGAAGDDFTLGDVIGASGGAVFAAAAGNETLNGASATGNLVLFGASQAYGAGAVDWLAGGSGNDTLIAGAGSETLSGGAGENVFLIDLLGAANATLTIADFSGTDSVAFGHFSAADVSSAIANGVETNAGFVVTFAESSTTVTFANVASASELDGHVITFS
jgi:hypothetical protein